MCITYISNCNTLIYSEFKKSHTIFGYNRLILTFSSNKLGIFGVFDKIFEVGKLKLMLSMITFYRDVSEPKPVAIKTSHGTYLRAEEGNGATVNTQNSIDIWETYHLVYLGNKQYGIRTHHHTWLRAEPGEHATVNTTYNLREWEHFEIVPAGGKNMWNIKTAHGTFLRAEPGHFATVNTATIAGPYEQFRIKEL